MVLAEELLPVRFPLLADLEPFLVDLELPADFDPPVDLPDELDRDDVPELFPALARPPLDPEADFAADDRPEVDLPLPDELERPPDLLPLEEDVDLDEPVDRPPPEADFPLALLPLDPDVDLRELPPERPELLSRPPPPDEDEPDRPRDVVIVSAAAPTAPTAAPAAAPLRISPATSMTFSTIPDDVDFLERADPRRDDFDEDELLFFELLELVLVGTIFLPNDRDKT